MTSSAQLNPRKTCRLAANVSSVNISHEHVSRMSLADAQQNNTSSEDRSCWTLLRQWFRNLLRRENPPDDISLPPSNETIRHRPMEFDRRVSVIYESLEENSITSQQHQLFPFKEPYATVKIVDRNSTSIACNDQHILIKQAPYLCLLDKQLTLVKEVLWGYDYVDICWSSVLRRFILISEKNVFMFDENTKKIDQCPIHLHDDRGWSSGACSESSLFLAVADLSSSLHEYALQPNLELVREWQLSDSRAPYDAILTVTYGNEKLALVISNTRMYQKRIDFRSSRTLDCLWSIPLDTIAHCCLVHDDQWMIIELFKSRLLHLSSDGQLLQEYHNVERSAMDIIWNAVQIDRGTLASFTKDSLNLHQLF